MTTRQTIRVWLGVALAAAPVAGPPAARAQEGGRAVDYSLESALRIALEGSPVLREARGRVVVAGQLVREAWGEVYPTVSADFSYQRNIRVQQAFLPAFLFDPTAPPEELVPVRFGSDNTWTAGFAVNQPLFQLDVLVGLSAADRFRAVERERFRGTAQGVVSSVRRAYLDALLLVEDVRLTTETIARTRQSLAETRGMNRAGVASDYDVLRLEVQLANLEPNLRRARNAAAAATRTLLVEMGEDPNQSVNLEGSLHTLNVQDPAANDPANAKLLLLSGVEPSSVQEFGAVYQGALELRSDLRELDLNANLQQSQLAAQRAEYFPSVSLFGSYNITAQQDDPMNFFGRSNQRTTFAFAGIRVDVPIFQGFKRSARMKQTRATIDQIVAQRERLERLAANQIRTVLDNVEEARERAIAQRRAVDEAQRGFDIASAEYRAGIGSQLQITDAEVALRQSEFNYAQAVYDYLVSRSQLDVAAGTVPDAVAQLAQRGAP